MTQGWTWRFETADGEPVSAEHAATQPFPSQSDAESWLGETWRELLDDGVEQVSLMEDERTVYGPMSLRPAP
jgi:hypothetical protein